MLTYIALCITAYLVFRIARAPSGADATGYLLVSAIIPLPLYIVGNSAQAAIFAVDVCLLAYLLAHGKCALDFVLHHRLFSAGLGAVIAFAILATYSGIFNFLFIDPGPLKFYAFTIVKFWEFALLALLLIANRPNPAQVRRICTVVLVGILIYEVLHVFQICGLAPLSGEAYFGPQAAQFNAGEMRADPFSDRTAWFLTSYRGAIGGTASISAWFSLMVFEAYRGRIRIVAAITVILSVFSILAVSSRSDTVGLLASACIFAICAPRQRWKTYAVAAIAITVLYTGYVRFVLPPAERTTATTRMSELWNPELRAEGDYADRSSDRASMLRYLPDHPRDLLIGVGPGNFHWYMDHRITYNFNGHNSYLQWAGELGLGGLFILLTWCVSILLYMTRNLRTQPHIIELVARAGLALIGGRIVAGWGSETLFGTGAMSCYSLYFLGIAYFLVSIMGSLRERRHPSRHDHTAAFSPSVHCPSLRCAPPIAQQ